MIKMDGKSVQADKAQVCFVAVQYINEMKVALASYHMVIISVLFHVRTFFYSVLKG